MNRFFFAAALFSISSFLQATHLKDPQKEPCLFSSRHMRASIRHIEAGGIGYNTGYTTIEGFVAQDPFAWQWMPFADLRGHVFNDGRFAANGGIGVRTIWGSRIYGANAYYDYRQGHHKGYSQISAGLETLGKIWDLRINGYLPVGGKRSYPYDLQFAGFVGNSILVSQKFEYALWGLDGEAGFHFGKTSDFDFYGAIGPYYFNGNLSHGAIGGKARLAGYYKDYITLEISDSFDNVFHNRFQGQVTFSFPIGPQTKAKPSGCDHPSRYDANAILAARMVQPVAKQEIVVLNTHKKQETTSFTVLFVNNLSNSLGTFESPYPTLLAAQNHSNPGDIIYVFPGDKTTSGMSDGIILKDNQKLWGSGAAHILNTEFGTITIPQSTALMPMITNTTGNAITLAQNNEISGISINAAFFSGISGTNPGNVTISSSSIFLCNQENTGHAGIELIYNNANAAIVLIDHVNISENLYRGIHVETNADVTVQVTIQNSIFTGNFYPLDFESYGQSIATLNFYNNTVSQNQDYMYVYSGSSSPSPQTFNFAGNVISATINDYSLFFQLDDPAIGALSLIDNLFTNNRFAADLIIQTNQTMNLDIQNNRFLQTFNSDSGLYISNSGMGQLLGSIHNNSFENNTTYGLEIIQNSSGGTICLDLQGNASTGNPSGGYFLSNTMGGTLKISPSNADAINTGGLFSNTMGPYTQVESCPSGAIAL